MKSSLNKTTIKSLACNECMALWLLLEEHVNDKFYMDNLHPMFRNQLQNIYDDVEEELEKKKVGVQLNDGCMMSCGSHGKSWL